MSEKLALFGGKKAVTLEKEMMDANRWPMLGKEELAAVEAVMRAPDVYSVTAEFEKEFAAYHGSKYALAHNNGTSSIQAAYFAAGVRPGDEVIVPSYTWHLGVSQVLTLHAIPVFCDVDPASGAMRPDDLLKKISPHTRAISVLHPFGYVAPMGEILKISRERGIPVIEDCSHAHGALYGKKKVGTLGDIGCFSLQYSKLMTGIEGGILITDNREYYERAVLLGHYERIPSLESPEYKKYCPGFPSAPTCFGFKYRIHPMASAIALAQLRKLDAMNAARRRNLDYLTAALGRLHEAFQPPPELPGTRRVYINYICQFYEEKMEGITRDRFVEALNAEGLPSTYGRAGYLPVYWNPLYEERGNMWAEGCPFDGPYVRRKVTYRRGDCPEAEKIWTRTINLPAFPNKCDESVLAQCVEAVAKVVRNRAQLLA